MKQTLPVITVIMPTLNSEKTIDLALNSLSKQTYPKDRIEILVIDGGSKDSTVQIALKYGATILPNPKVQPEHAKSIGLNKAKGEYAMFLDSDEVLRSSKSLANKVKLLLSNPTCKNIVTTGLRKPAHYPFLCDYINKFGDPFSFFMYRIDSGNFFESLKRRYSVSISTEEYEIIDFKKNDLTPIVDGGGHLFDLDFLKSVEDIKHVSLSARVFSSMVFHTHRLGVLKDDYIEHYSSPGLGGYLRKIKWRIVSNLSLGNNIPGYKNREQYVNKVNKVKKYLFLPYALLLLPVLIDSLYLALKNKDIRYFIHTPLAFYTAIEIIIQSIFVKGSHSAGAYGNRN
jgi:glycosyltransferase involved in cell wall biosynthesis